MEDEDLFQCGKCKKQFTSLTVFMTHKREHCNMRTILPANSQSNVTHSSAFTVNQPVASRPQNGMSNLSQQHASPPVSSIPSTTCGTSLSLYNPVPTSPLAQIGQSMVIGTDDMVTFTTIDQGIPMHNGMNLQALTNHNPFMPQVSPVSRTLTSTSNNVTMSSTPTAVYTSTFPVSQPQAQTILSIGSPIRPSPNKSGRRDGQSNVITNLDATKGRRRGMDTENTGNSKVCTWRHKNFKN